MSPQAEHAESSSSFHVPRSFLYVPGVRPELFTKATAGPSDALILDLEDAVPLDAKEAAREHIRRWLADVTSGPADREAAGPDDDGARSSAQQWVRVNAEYVEDDLEAVVAPGLDGLFLAKCSETALARLATRLDKLEKARGLPRGRLRVIGLVEDAHALLDLDALAAHPRLLTFGIGEVDLLGDLRMVRSDRSAAAVDSLRQRVVLAAAAAGLAAPVAPTSTAFRDLDAFEESTRHLHDLGFRSRTAVHPGQVPVIHRVMTPGPDEVARACAVLEESAAAGGGVTVDAQGRMVDAAVLREAREVLGRADRR